MNTKLYCVITRDENENISNIRASATDQHLGDQVVPLAGPLDILLMCEFTARFLSAEHFGGDMLSQFILAAVNQYASFEFLCQCVEIAESGNATHDALKVAAFASEFMTNNIEEILK
jgi:hypothetical protein